MGNSYGQQQQKDFQTANQQQQDFQTTDQQQPLIRNMGNSYGQQQQLDQSVNTVKSNNAYGQQAQPTFSDLIRDAGFSQQAQQGIVQPTLKTASTGYGQQPQLDQPILPVRSNNAYGQQTQPAFNDLVRGGGYGQQVQQKMFVPQVRTINAGYGQQQPDVSSGQSWTDVSRSNSAFMPSSRMLFQAQPTVQMANSGSYGGN